MLNLVRYLIDPQIDTLEGASLFLRSNGGWWFAALILIASLFCVWTYRRIGTEIRPRYRRQLIMWRLAMLLVLFFLLLRPTLQFSAQRRPVVAVVVDTSSSMKTADPGVGERYKLASRTLVRRATPASASTGSASDIPARIEIAAAAARELATSIAGPYQQGFAVRKFGFDASLREAPHDTIEARGVRTNLTGSLRELARAMRGEPLIAIVVISDGIDNVGENVQDMLRSLGRSKTPVFAVAVGGTTERPDLRLTDIRSPAFSFLGSQFAVETSFAWQQIEGAAEVRLFVDDEQIDTKPVEMIAERGSTRLRFDVPADTQGRRFCRLEIPAREGEASSENNVRHFSVEVLDDFRVLLVTATPRSEFRFLRQFLERDSRIRVTSLLGTPGGRPGQFFNISRNVGDRELAFPATERQIRVYQAVIFGDVDTHQLNREQQEVLRSAVSDRGIGFLMLGGMHAFGSGDYSGTPIADLLPVEIVGNGESHDNENFLPLVTARGQSMPFFQSSAFASGEFKFAELPPVGGLNVVGQLKPTATALAVHPRSGAVVMAIAPYGRGRTMALTIDETWRWRFEDAWQDNNPASQFYQDFWGQIVRWLGVPSERSGLRISLPAKDVAAGSLAQVEVQLLDEELSAIEGVTPALTIRRQSDDSADPIDQPYELTAQAGDRGKFKSKLIELQAGTYWLRASAEDTLGNAWNDEELLVVRPPSLEIERTSRDDALLNTLCLATGGTFCTIEEMGTIPAEIAEIPFRQRRRFRNVGETELWDAWSVLALLIGIYTLELRTRRKAGIL